MYEYIYIYTDLEAICPYHRGGGVKGPCAPGRFDFECTILKFRSSTSKLAQVPEQSELTYSGSFVAAIHL